MGNPKAGWRVSNEGAEWPDSQPKAEWAFSRPRAGRPASKERAGWPGQGAAGTIAVSLSFLLLFAVVAFAQDVSQDSAGQTPAAGSEAGAEKPILVRQTLDPRQNTPGQFDFYVLALSWSPSYCAAAAERRPNRGNDPQCGGRPFSFVVHGLWPQYTSGFPSYCQVPSPRLNRGIVGANLDMMPSPKLIYHEWDRHGTCSGLSAGAFFETVRKARAVVKLPADYLDLNKPIMVTPTEVADAFAKANPALPRGGLKVACSGKWLSEVRVCLNKDLSFRDCPEVTDRSCRRDKVVMPAVRGG